MKALYEILVTLVAYMLFPFIYFYALNSKMSKREIKLFNFINSIVIMFIFTGVYVFLEKDTLYTGAPALLYWFINNAIYTRYSVSNNSEKDKFKEIVKQDTKSDLNKDKRNRKIKMKKNKDNKIIIISICGVITIAIISSSILINTYLKEQSDREQTQMKLDSERENEENRQYKLSNCISTAKTNRTDLWESNCPEKNPNCSLNSDIVDWIDKRYQQELNSCYQLYGN